MNINLGNNKMDNLEIRTNNHLRLIIDAYQLTENDRKEFDYLDWDAIDVGSYSAEFFKYKGRLYDLGEFMRCDKNGDFKKWDGYSSDSAFSGILIKYSEDRDHVIVGQYFS